MSKEVPRERIDKCGECPSMGDCNLENYVMGIAWSDQPPIPKDCPLKDWQEPPKEPQPVQWLDKPDSEGWWDCELNGKYVGRWLYQNKIVLFTAEGGKLRWTKATLPTDLEAHDRQAKEKIRAELEKLIGDDLPDIDGKMD